MKFIDKLNKILFKEPVPGNILAFMTNQKTIKTQVFSLSDNDTNLFEAVKEFAEQHTNPLEMIFVKKFPIDDINIYQDIKTEVLSSAIHNLDPQPYIGVYEVLFYAAQTSDHTFSPKAIEEYVQEHFVEYLKMLKTNDLQDIPRMDYFIEKAVINDINALKYLKDKSNKLIDNIIKESSYSVLPYLNNEEKSFSICLQEAKKFGDYFKFNELPLNFTKEEIIQILNSCTDTCAFYRADENYTYDVICANNLSKLPKHYLESYNFSDVLSPGIDSYARVMSTVTATNQQLFDAMVFYAENRFQKGLSKDVENDSGHFFRYEIYINSDLKNPSKYFAPSLLTPEQWHSIVEIDTNMMEHIPLSILENKEFWNNYQSFINRGTFLKDPSNIFQKDSFDENMVFSNMPPELRKDPQIMDELLEKKIVPINFFINIPENIYLKYGYREYDKIPEDVRTKESFRECAIKAVNEDCRFIQWVPKRFLTQEMIEKVLLEDIRLFYKIPQGCVTENIWNNISAKITDQMKDLSKLFNDNATGHNMLDSFEAEGKLRAFKTLGFNITEAQGLKNINSSSQKELVM